jgi:hypothetical protein
MPFIFVKCIVNSTIHKTFEKTQKKELALKNIINPSLLKEFRGFLVSGSCG